MAWVDVRCPECGKIAEADVHEVPLLRSSDDQLPVFMFNRYRWPSWCRGEDHITELNALLGTSTADTKLNG